MNNNCQWCQHLNSVGLVLKWDQITQVHKCQAMVLVFYLEETKMLQGFE